MEELIEGSIVSKCIQQCVCFQFVIAKSCLVCSCVPMSC